MEFYIGVEPCGCVVAACVDAPEYKDGIKKFMKDCIDDGRTVEHITSDVGPKLIKCECVDSRISEETVRCDKTVDMFEGEKG